MPCYLNDFWYKTKFLPCSFNGKSFIKMSIFHNTYFNIYFNLLSNFDT